MPGPNGESCDNCQCKYSLSDPNRIGSHKEYCVARAPGYVLLVPNVPQNFQTPPLPKQRFCIHDYKPMTND